MLFHGSIHARIIILWTLVSSSPFAVLERFVDNLILQVLQVRRGFLVEFSPY